MNKFVGFFVYISHHDYQENEYNVKRRDFERLGGKISDNLRKNLTCVVLKNVMNPDYEDCLKRLPTVPLVSDRWLKECITKREPVDLNKYLLKCFDGLTICSTGLTPDKQDQIIDLVERNGGKFSGKLIKSETTHLICENMCMESAKIKAAIEWNIPIVNITWISDCEKKKSKNSPSTFLNILIYLVFLLGYLKEDKYLVKRQKSDHLESIDVKYNPSQQSISSVALEDKENDKNFMNKSLNNDLTFESSKANEGVKTSKRLR